MKEKEIHKIIEQQNLEAKQLIWEKVINILPELAQNTTSAEIDDLEKDCKSKRGKEKLPK